MENKNALYTQGPAGRPLFKNSQAMLPGTIAVSGYNIVDSCFVGQSWRDTLAALFGILTQKDVSNDTA